MGNRLRLRAEGPARRRPDLPRAGLGSDGRLLPARLPPGARVPVRRCPKARTGAYAVVATGGGHRRAPLLAVSSPGCSTIAAADRRRRGPRAGVARWLGRCPPRERRAGGGIPERGARLLRGCGEHGPRRQHAARVYGPLLWLRGDGGG